MCFRNDSIPVVVGIRATASRPSNDSKQVARVQGRHVCNLRYRSRQAFERSDRKTAIRSRQLYAATQVRISYLFLHKAHGHSSTCIPQLACTVDDSITDYAV